MSGSKGKANATHIVRNPSITFYVSLLTSHFSLLTSYFSLFTFHSSLLTTVNFEAGDSAWPETRS